MGKNAKLNRELAKLGMALSREDLYYYICYKVEKHLTYKKTCRIANEIVLSNGFKCMASFDDRKMDANYNKLLAMAKIKNFTFDIKDEDIPNYPYITFPEGSEEYNYLHGRRKA